MKKQPLTDRAGEVRELLAEDIRAMKPAEEVLPAELLAALPKRRPGQRGRQKTPTKKQVTIRLDDDLVARLRQGGPGWQSRINAALRKAVGL